MPEAVEERLDPEEVCGECEDDPVNVGLRSVEVEISSSSLSDFRPLYLLRSSL